jgi:hypothetical protein
MGRLPTVANGQKRPVRTTSEILPNRPFGVATRQQTEKTCAVCANLAVGAGEQLRRPASSGTMHMTLPRALRWFHRYLLMRSIVPVVAHSVSHCVPIKESADMEEQLMDRDGFYTDIEQITPRSGGFR